MSLILVANNQTLDRSGKRILKRKNGSADFGVQAYVGGRPIWNGTIRNYQHAHGAPGLIRRISEAMARARRKEEGNGRAKAA